MKVFFAKDVYTATGWCSQVYFHVDNHGIIRKISDECKNDCANLITLDGWLIPGFFNSHSHAFQYVQTGWAECLNSQSPSDDFWGWRQSMYRLALSIDPDQMESIAAFVYGQMLANGYTSVAEFHYLHHDKDGTPFLRPEEMSVRLMAAAQQVGIQLTLIPTYYAKSNFGQTPLAEQRRFICKDSETYLKLRQRIVAASKDFSRSQIAFGFHSLRAAPIDDIQEILNDHDGSTPIHLHIGEQLKEVEDCLRFTGQTPVEYLANNVHLDHNFHLIHATHINDEEASLIVNAGSHVSLCPSTEGNLGDGLFPLTQFLDQGGSISVGTDSHIGLCPMENLRWLDYGQRLLHKRRNILANSTCHEYGDRLYNLCLSGGAKSCGRTDDGFLNVGEYFDAVLIDPSHPHFIAKPKEKRISTLVYGCDQRAILCTITAGTIRYQNGSLENEDTLKHNYKKAVEELLP